jgi:biotin-(acetyl-CoA carboxylase) ligase
VEMRAQDKSPHLAVVGIGINVNQCRDDFPDELQDSAISLAMALGRQLDRQNFAVALLRNLDRTYREKFSKAVGVFNSSPAPTTTRDKRPAKSRKA